ncbi:MAG: SDR family oxidoreductase [Burkholderiales bacterium]
MSRTALIAGATGTCAKRLLEVLLADRWSVVGLARRPPPDAAAGPVRWVRADLLDAADTRRALADASGVTHVFYTARAKHGEGGDESVADNAAMFAHLLDAIVPVARGLEHVHLVQGGKYYGLHRGPYPTPAEEDDPRPAVPNFYYDQQDRLEARQRGERWTWSASRPNVICDFAPERSRNLVSLIGAYAAILRERGEPLAFPGTRACWQALTEVTDATHFARAIVHLASAPGARNRAYNVTNGDLFRWERLWPRLAAYFGMAVGDIVDTPLAQRMADSDEDWRRVVRRHRLVDCRLEDLANWAYGDFVFRQGHDVASSTTRLRRTGFDAVVDTPTMFADQLGHYREARRLP